VDAGPDAYRDDGRGAVSDRHGFRPEAPSRDAPWSRFGPRPAPDRDHRADGLLAGERRIDAVTTSRTDRDGSYAQRAEAGSVHPGDRSDSRQADRGPAGAAGDPIGPVPGNGHVSGGRPADSADQDDDTLTSPLPVILPGALPGATAVPRPDPVAVPRGPFEPARPSQPYRSTSITGSVEPPPAAVTASVPVPPPPRPMPEAAAAKLDQIKDLYLTAEAIGAGALDKHFDQVSHRQRELIREFFERSQRDDDSLR
jgi:hypothetical protein